MKNNKKTIGILGAGWLGKELAFQLKALDFTCRATVRQPDDVAILEQSGIKSYIIDIKEDKIFGDLKTFLEGLNTLVVAIPPGLRKNPDSDFAYKVRMIAKFALVYKIPDFIFVSSTSVFQDTFPITTYSENNIPNSQSNTGKKIIAAEEELRNWYPNATILRPCGLIGDDRHPINHLKGKTDLKNPDMPVNLVNRNHVINLIIGLINETIKTKVLHAVSEPHTSRKEYYQDAARQRNLAPPEFLDSSKQEGKIITSIYS